MPRQTNIQIRRGASSAWVQSAENLEAGELGWDTDNKILKIGDGSSWGSTNALLPNFSKYKTLIGDGTETSFTINHNLNAASETFVTVRNDSGEYVSPDIKYVDEDNVLVEFATAPSSNQYLVSIVGINLG